MMAVVVVNFEGALMVVEVNSLVVVLLMMEEEVSSLVV